jgi:hypothetical protein
MNQHPTTLIRSAAPGNANHGVALPVPRATMLLWINATVPTKKTTNAFQPSPSQLRNPPASVRRCNVTISTRTHTLTASRGPLKSP